MWPATDAPEPRPLVIALGNPLRGDDGVGWAVAAPLREKADVLRVRQLMPELASLVAAARAVVFVDAATRGAPGEVAWRLVRPALPASTATAHALSPEALLAIAAGLHGAAPAAVLVTVAGREFGYREGLSDEVLAAVPVARACVRAALPLTSRHAS
jgi:hydrogenase maturation protease